MNKQQAKMKSARKKIEAILKEYDLAGYVSIHGGEGWGEVFWSLWPTWSILQGDLPDIRIKSRLSDIAPSERPKEMERRKQTSQAIYHLGTTMAPHAMNFLELSKLMDELLQTEHEDKGHFPDRGDQSQGGH